MTLAAVVTRARVQERNVEADLFLSVASDVAVRMAMVLSISVELGDADLQAITRSLWGEEGEDWDSALGELARWPFVARSSSGWRTVGPVGAALAIKFQETNPSAFSRAHEALAAFEEEQEATAHPDEQWFARGRIAYYLAGFDETRSAATFRETFANAPVMERPLARMWLAGLAIRQEYLLGSESRTIEFFRGFRLYVTGHRRDAATSFELVFEGGIEDVYSAIAMHLWAVVVGTRAGTRGRRILEDSIDLSEQIGLADNAVMARHTLTWSMVAEALQGQERPDARREIVDGALVLARLNREAADATLEAGLMAWTHRTVASVEWIATREQATGTADPDLVERLLSELADIQATTLAMFDLETAAYAANDAAGILRDESRFVEALATLDAFLLDAEKTGVIPTNALTNLAKTAGSMFRMTRDRAIHESVESTLATVDRLKG